jgi:hypothetical protein
MPDEATEVNEFARTQHTLALLLLACSKNISLEWFKIIALTSKDARGKLDKIGLVALLCIFEKWLAQYRTAQEGGNNYAGQVRQMESQTDNPLLFLAAFAGPEIRDLLADFFRGTNR